MVYATVLEAVDESHGGSSPLLGTRFRSTLWLTSGKFQPPTKSR
jgi:hypothetical protein